MQVTELDEKINSFLKRKAVKFPDLALSGRHESRTVKYAETREESMHQHRFVRGIA